MTEEAVRQFLEQHHDAIMVTLKPDGTPHVARVFVGLVGGQLWSSGTRRRSRTKHVLRDPRATLCVLDATTRFRWLGLETTVTILDGHQAPQQNLALYRLLAGEPESEAEYLQAMVREERLIYQFAITRSYGQL